MRFPVVDQDVHPAELTQRRRRHRPYLVGVAYVGHETQPVGSESRHLLSDGVYLVRTARGHDDIRPGPRRRARALALYLARRP